MKAEIAAKPSRVLFAVEDALVMSEQAAAAIVKSAIETTRADKKLVGDIVFTAIRQAPSMSASIVESAVEARPSAADEIKTALQRALGEADDEKSTTKKADEDMAQGSGKSVVSVKSSVGKEPVAKEPSGKEAQAPAPAANEGEDDTTFDFGLNGPGVGGIYFATPSSGTSGDPRRPRVIPPDDTDDSDDNDPPRVTPPDGVSGETLTP